MRGPHAMTRATPRWPLIALAIAALWVPHGALASDFWDELRTPGLGAYHAAVARGVAALSENRPAEALELAAAAAARLRDRPTAHTLSGLALATLGRFSEAVSAFERALALDPAALDDKEATIRTATAAARVGRLDLSRQVLLRFLARAGDAETRRTTRLLCGHVLLASGPEHLRRAMQLYREAIREGDASPEALLSLALALHRSGDVEGARVLATRVADSGQPRAQLLPTWLPGAERHARMALLLGALGEREGERTSWQQSRSEGGPWSTNAAIGPAPEGAEAKP